MLEFIKTILTSPFCTLKQCEKISSLLDVIGYKREKETFKGAVKAYEASAPELSKYSGYLPWLQCFLITTSYKILCFLAELNRKDSDTKMEFYNMTHFGKYRINLRNFAEAWTLRITQNKGSTSCISPTWCYRSITI